MGVMMFCGLTIGVLVSVMTGISSWWLVQPSQTLTETPREFAQSQSTQNSRARQLARTRPMEIKLIIHSHEEFARLRDEGKMYATTEAWSNPIATPCQIHLEEGQWLTYVPATGDAAFVRDRDDVILAHELLHCIVGFWHPKWDEIIKNMREGGPINYIQKSDGDVGLRGASPVGGKP